MFFLPSFLMKSPEQRAREAKEYAARVEARCATAVPWDPEMKWTPTLTVQAHTYTPRMVFEVTPTRKLDVNGCEPDEKVVSPSGEWLYCCKLLPRGAALATFHGSRRGTVMFDGDVQIPCLYTKTRAGLYWTTPADRGAALACAAWEELPFMSLTPMEMLTLRVGTRLARGRTIVAGLGLGHQLIEVSHRKKIGDIVLVEKSQELVDWILPRIAPQLGRPLADVIVGDARKVLPTLKADIALVDIFPNYGNNDFYAPCPDVKRVWCWGGATV